MIRTDIYERIEHERRDAALVVCGHATDHVCEVAA
jgi:hypothetical protein